MIKININGVEKMLEKPTKIIDFITNDNYNYMAAKVNNRIRELNYTISKNCDIELLTLNDANVTRMYQATLRYVILMAISNVYPDAKTIFNFSVSRTIFASVQNLGKPFSKEHLETISNEVNRLISLDLPISRHNMDIEEAKSYYKQMGYNDKVKVLNYRKERIVHMYECNGYKNYMFGYMLPSTGYLKTFGLKLYTPGFLITYPRSECNGMIPKYTEERVFRAALKEANQWADVSKSSYIWQKNEIIEAGNALEFINICEARHNKQFVELAEDIFKNIDNIKLIAVAGPSSSGKTTFTNRLKIELKSRGINPFMISLDNFYDSPDKAPLDEEGKPDFEHIEALDVALFNELIFKLIQGESVKLPIYNFSERKRTFTEPMKLSPNQPILIEGIHALNELLTSSIPSEFKYKIFIAPLGQYRIDDHNPISISDVRLIRRIVRDNMYRNTDCERTLETWQSVRNGEFRWIYPFQNDADFVFNSELSYELCVMQKYAVPLLKSIKNDSPNFITANRLLKFLKYYDYISDKWIPCNSILREFIGDSIFYTEDKK